MLMKKGSPFGEPFLLYIVLYQLLIEITVKEKKAFYCGNFNW